MKVRRVLFGLICVSRDDPTFDTELDEWLLAHNLRDPKVHDLTTVGKIYLNTIENLASEALNRFKETGQLRRPDHDQKEDTDNNTDNRTPQQARRKAAKGRKG